MSFDFDSFCQQYINQLQNETSSSPSSSPVEKVTSESVTYKCINGSTCKNNECIHIHPGEKGYYITPYKVFQKKCHYETDVTACRKKCGSRNGRYCPFRHCNHFYFPNQAITCTQIDCQAHCPSCI